jgi:hypothetical protein
LALVEERTLTANMVYIGSLMAGLKSAAPGENLQSSKFFKINLNVHLDMIYEYLPLSVINIFSIG